jgi:octaprenyl-diphosphate synthase
MVRAPSEPGVQGAAADLSTGRLACLFGIDDLADRLAAVDDRIAEALGRDDALLGRDATAVAGSGGKRLRPLLTIVAAALGGVFDDAVVDVAAAVELVQVGSLVHDDILDGADTRRGQPTINAARGVGQALLAGDYILARAAELAAGVSGEAALILAGALGELCEGQAVEMRDLHDPGRSVDAHLASIRAKTAALFGCACRLGAIGGGLSETNREALARFGAAFGMAFQVLDDVLDVIGDAGRMGKPTGNDIVAGVYTLPVIRALAGPDGDELRALLAEGSRDDLHAALDVVRRPGTMADALALADRYGDEARRAVRHLDQTTVGEGLASFPRVYATWALENLMDRRYRAMPLTATGFPG